MYNQNRSSSGTRSFARPSFKSSSSRGRGGSSRGFAPRSRGGGRGERIDISKFINKRVIAKPAEKFVPVHLFNDFALDQRIKANVAAKGYQHPTPVQDAAIPHILNGVDMVALADTGTGKTAAFLLPLIHKVLAHPDESVLIMAPTRELAVQIDQEFQGFATGLRLSSVVTVGGAPIGRQISQLRFKPHFIIGTPGRIKDLVERRFIRLDSFKTLVLDEADRMLDMGFVNDMRLLMSKMPAERQSLFFSATLSSEIEKLIKEFLKNPTRISVKTRETSEHVEQDIVRVDRGSKIEVLSELLKKSDFSKVLVFGKTKHGVEKLSTELNKRGFKTSSIHGNKNHTHRQRSLGQFKQDQIQVLVATDVAARGLDIPDVTHVINYDIPMTHADYVHRIGRTGRGGKIGKALTFVE